MNAAKTPNIGCNTFPWAQNVFFRLLEWFHQYITFQDVACYWTKFIPRLDLVSWLASKRLNKKNGWHVACVLTCFSFLFFFVFGFVFVHNGEHFLTAANAVLYSWLWLVMGDTKIWVTTLVGTGIIAFMLCCMTSSSIISFKEWKKKGEKTRK